MVLPYVAAGFPSPAEDYMDQALDLNEHLIKHPAATFFIRVKGNSMIGAGIFNGDIVIIDRSLEARNRDIVLAVVSGEFTLKRFLKTSRGLILQPENPNYKPLLITEEMEFTVWGVVIHSIRKHR